MPSVFIHFLEKRRQGGSVREGKVDDNDSTSFLHGAREQMEARCGGRGVGWRMASGGGNLVSSVWGRRSRGGAGPGGHVGRRPGEPESSYWASRKKKSGYWH
jgi:hypothetical protein